MNKRSKRYEYTERDLAHYRALVDNIARFNEVPTIYVILRSVSRSGMTRRLSLRAFNAEGQAYSLSMLAEAFGSHSLDKEGNVVVRGCGFDAGFSVVDCIARGMGVALKHQWL